MDKKAKRRIVTRSGNQYCSIRAACAGEGINRTTYIKRIKAGVSQIDALDPNFSNANHKSIKVLSQCFNSKKEAANYYGIPYGKFLDRLSLGWSVEQALEIEERKTKPSYYPQNVKEFAKSQSDTVNNVESRLARRRRRFRKWLKLPVISVQAHVNAIHTEDEDGNYYYSLRKAAQKKRTRSTTVRQLVTTVEDDRVFGERHCLDSELKVSIDTLITLMTHPNVVQREICRTESARIIFDHFTYMQYAVYHYDEGVFEAQLLYKKQKIVSCFFQPNQHVDVSLKLHNYSEGIRRLEKGMCIDNLENDIAQYLLSK